MSKKITPATHPERFVLNPAKAEDYKDMSKEDLQKGLAYWVNLANHRGNRLLSELPEKKSERKSTIGSEKLKLVMGSIWATVMEGTAWCGWTDRAREGLLKEVQDSVDWALSEDGEAHLTARANEARKKLQEEESKIPNQCFRICSAEGVECDCQKVLEDTSPLFKE